MAIIAQIRVPRTINISIADRKLFFKPNCKGVNIKLKIKFNKKGKATINGISLFNAIRKTLP